MSVAASAQTALTEARIFLADPVTGTPTAPGDNSKAQVNTVWGFVLWVVVIGAVFGLGYAGVKFYSSHQRGEEGAGMKAAGMVVAGIILAFAAPSVVGAITGT